MWNQTRYSGDSPLGYASLNALACDCHSLSILEQVAIPGAKALEGYENYLRAMHIFPLL